MQIKNLAKKGKKKTPALYFLLSVETIYTSLSCIEQCTRKLISEIIGKLAKLVHYILYKINKVVTH
jgi:hypothetical protein